MRRAAVGLLLALASFAPASAQAPLLTAQACLGCHGPGAIGQTPIAGLAGRPAADLVAAMTEFRANQRPGTIMGRIARGYTDAEIAALAAHFAALPPGGAR